MGGQVPLATGSKTTLDTVLTEDVSRRKVDTVVSEVRIVGSVNSTCVVIPEKSVLMS
jgi:hypothetical protein